MKTNISCSMPIVVCLLLLSLLGPLLSTTFAQGSTFTYQGSLNVGGAPVNGNFDFIFSIYPAGAGGTAISAPETNIATPVNNGLFTTELNFGNGVFTGSNVWLDIQVRTNGGGGTFTELAPRQLLLPAPYAIFANAASNLTGALASTQLTGNIPATQLSGTISLARLPVTVVTNMATGVTLNGTFVGNGGGLTNLSPAALSGQISLAQLPAGVLTNAEGGVTLNSLSVSAPNQTAPLAVPPRLPAAVVGSANTGPYPQSLIVAGCYVYVVNNGANSLQVFDVSIPSAPTNVGTVGTGSGPTSVAVAGRYAYVLNGNDNTLQIFDINNPSAPTSIATVGTGSSPSSVVVAGRYAYVVNNLANNLQIFDVSNPYAPSLFGTVTTDSEPCSVAVAGRYAYVVNAGAWTLQVFDVSNPAAPVRVATVATGPQPFSVAVVGRYAYVGDSKLQIFDVSDPANPVLAGQAVIEDLAFSVVVSGHYAYIPRLGNDDLEIIDLSNPSNPVTVGLTSTGTSPFSIAVAGRYAYVVNNDSYNLQVLDFGGAYIQQLESGALETGTLQTRDTVTVGNNLDVGGGLTVSASARISGGLSVDSRTNSDGALSVSSSGSGLIAEFGNSNSFVCVITNDGTIYATAFNSTSDRNQKENFTPVSPVEVLAKVAALPITRWNFKSGQAIEHIGPMAQDFHAAFDVGTDDKHIATVDEEGVALAAIQGLNQKLEADVKERDAKISELENRLQYLERAVESLKVTK